jgi:sulfite reductase alpha subunit-like flavoprotein
MLQGHRSNVETDRPCLFRYQAGDWVGIVPQNTEARVERAARLLRLDLHDAFTLTAADKHSGVPLFPENHLLLLSCSQPAQIQRQTPTPSR